tara:strand:- start:1086 stop:1271 length:186 start_codon:yes stop_codon:yes gene_type:complete
MINYLYGAATFYGLGALLMLNITDPTDPNRPNAHVWYSLGWPVMAVISIYEMIRYGPEEDE